MMAVFMIVVAGCQNAAIALAMAIMTMRSALSAMPTASILTPVASALARL
jgi:hypothetical protein